MRIERLEGYSMAVAQEAYADGRDVAFRTVLVFQQPGLHQLVIGLDEGGIDALLQGLSQAKAAFHGGLQIARALPPQNGGMAS